MMGTMAITRSGFRRGDGGGGQPMPPLASNNTPLYVNEIITSCNAILTAKSVPPSPILEG